MNAQIDGDRRDEECSVCGGRPNRHVTLSAYDHTVFIGIPLCQICLTALTANEGITLFEPV